MNSLEKLEEVINVLEYNSNCINEYSQVYLKISTLQQDISNNLSLLQDNNKNFYNISEYIKNNMQDTKIVNNNHYENLEKILTQLNESLLIQIQGIEFKNNNFHQELRDIFKKMNESLLNEIQQLYYDNKIFQKELDSSIFSRLDKTKSDIQVEIRNESVQISKNLENFLNIRLNLLESTQKELLTKQQRQLNNLKFLSFGIIAFNIVLTVFILIK